MNPHFVSKPAFTAIGMKYRGQNLNREIPKLWDAFGPRTVEIPHLATPPVAYGIQGNFDSATGEFDYLAGRGVTAVDSLPEGMVSWHVPEGYYAVFPAKLTDDLRALYHDIYTQWLPTSGYQDTEAPYFEYYDEHFQGDDSTFYIYIPVKK
jgi:AraC family transcriptional regulator